MANALKQNLNQSVFFLMKLIIIYFLSVSKSKRFALLSKIKESLQKNLPVSASCATYRLSEVKRWHDNATDYLICIHLNSL